MMNGRQRARWLAVMISELQRHHSRAGAAPEAGHVRRALAALDEARRSALESQYDDEKTTEE